MYHFDQEKCLKIADKLYDDKLQCILGLVDSIHGGGTTTVLKVNKVPNEAGFTNNYTIKINQANAIVIEGRKIKGALCHPHVFGGGSPCFGDADSDVRELLEKDIVGFVEYLIKFLGFYSQHRSVTSWREARITEAT